ncbi:hypothetical protein CRM22_005119 [Opisthorchis felineus]|uniref:LRRCT domain-containing protein n=1 Tax=Opisthorchis felineus TaxID=147828 RepID=A0A4S2LTW9_OPIFE|nr:hypothetical protein CRM22_005119 [Opisthorchis felineus]
MQAFDVPLYIALVLSAIVPVNSNNEQCHCEEKLKACKCTNVNATSLEQLLLQRPTLCTPFEPSAIAPQPVNATDLSRLVEAHSCSRNALSVLVIQHSAIERLKPTDFAKFPNLSEIRLSNNPVLSTYDEGAFEALGSRLTALVLESNPVRSLTREVFRGLHSLTRLVLSDNKIGYIESGVFSRNCCASLRELRLDRNILTVLDADTFLGLSSLVILDLRHNPLQMVDVKAFSPFSSFLTELYMSHEDRAPYGGFDSPVPGLFTNLSQLMLLHMDELKLRNLTAQSFYGLRNLRELSLRGNRLVQLPSDVFGTLERLERLDLSGNRLVCIASALNPDEQKDFLSGLELRWVDLSWNHLTHMNHLTARSLGLFDSQPRHERSRLVLNLTGNPWQHFDVDTFCNPQRPNPIRPTDLIVGPAPNTMFEMWHTSLGLWYARAAWPNGPFALIGPKSRVFGLLLDEENAERSMQHTTQDTYSFDYRSFLVGATDSKQRCQAIKVAELSGTIQNYSSSFPNELRALKLPTATAVAYSISSYCPRLAIRKIENWELSTLKITNQLMSIYDPITDSNLRGGFEKGSRLYLLVIVGICVTFLLIALTVIMCYRAWSRRTSLKCIDEINRHELCPPCLEPSAEKHLLLKNHIDQAQIPLITDEAPNKQPHEKERSVAVNGIAGSKEKTQPLPELEDHIDQPARLSRTGPYRVGRPKSDSDANELDETHKLTAFGVV